MAGVDMDTVAGFLSAQQQLATRGQRLDFTVDTLHTLCQVTIVTLCSQRQPLLAPYFHPAGIIIMFCAHFCRILHNLGRIASSVVVMSAAVRWTRRTTAGCCWTP